LLLSAESVIASAPADTSRPIPAVVLQAWSKKDAAMTTAISGIGASLGVFMSLSPDINMLAAITATSEVHG
jgi:hypothetical protein